MPVTVLLADDHALFREGLRHILEDSGEFTVVAETGSGLEAVALAGQVHPEVALVDIAMKELNGVEATAQLLKHSPRTAVLILSMYSDEGYVVRSVKAGAQGYLLKDTIGEDLIRAIQLVLRGQAYFSPEVARALQIASARDLKRREADDRYETLTERERQVYHLLAEGRSNKEIATRLGMSVHTAATHRMHVMEKLGLHSIAEVVLSAVRRGLVT